MAQRILVNGGLVCGLCLYGRSPPRTSPRVLTVHKKSRSPISIGRGSRIFYFYPNGLRTSFEYNAVLRYSRFKEKAV
jgi:hypothetical protein